MSNGRIDRGAPKSYGNVMGDQPRASNDWYQDQPLATEALMCPAWDWRAQQRK